MDLDTITGIGVVVSALLVFCGSVWLLLTMVLGARLAYFVTASVTLGFVLIMGVVWSINQLGPLHEMPTWNEEAIGPSVSEFGYPEGDWFVPNEDDQQQSTQTSEFEGDAVDYLERAIEAEREGINFEEAEDGTVVADATRLIEVDGVTYGGTVIEPIDEAEAPGGGAPDPVVAVMSYDPGNPLLWGRRIAIGSFILLVLHLFGLSRAERKAKVGRAAEVV